MEEFHEQAFFDPPNEPVCDAINRLYYTGGTRGDMDGAGGIEAAPDAFMAEECSSAIRQTADAR